jgi:ribose transport system substrate-binding protein
MPAAMRILLAILVMAGAAGCHRGERQIVGVVPKGANHIFWQTVHAGAIRAAQEYGFEVQWNAPALEIDSSRQIAIVDSMINQHLSGIVLAPVDKSALVAVVERAGRAGIPVAIFDSGIDTGDILCYVATDNLEAGRMAARRMGSILGGKGKVGVVGFMAGSASTMQREDGFTGEIKKSFPSVEITGVQFGMADRAKAMAVAENLLTAHPDLAGIYADNESSAEGALQAVSTRGAKVKLVVMDASETLLAALRTGTVDSIVVQNPFRMGYESTKAIGMKLRNENPQRLQDSGATLVRREDLEREDIRQLLFPDINQYLHPQ